MRMVYGEEYWNRTDFTLILDDEYFDWEEGFLIFFGQDYIVYP